MERIVAIIVISLGVSLLVRLSSRARARGIQKTAPDGKSGEAALEPLQAGWRAGKSYQELKQIAASSGIRRGEGGDLWLGLVLAAWMTEDPQPRPEQEAFRRTHRSLMGRYMAAALLAFLAVWGWFSVSDTSVTAAVWFVLILGGIGGLILKSVFQKLRVRPDGLWLGRTQVGWEAIGGRLYRGTAQLEGEAQALAGGSFMVGGQLHDFLAFEGGPYIKALINMRVAQWCKNHHKGEEESRSIQRTES